MAQGDEIETQQFEHQELSGQPLKTFLEIHVEADRPAAAAHLQIRPRTSRVFFPGDGVRFQHESQLTWPLMPEIEYASSEFSVSWPTANDLAGVWRFLLRVGYGATPEEFEFEHTGNLRLLKKETFSGQ